MRKPKPSNLIYGYHAVEAAFEAQKSIDKVFVANNLNSETISHFQNLCKTYKVSFQKVPKEKIMRITNANHQGIIAFVSPIEFQPLEEIVSQIFESGETPFFVALDEISDVRNFGAIARTANSAGVHALIIPQKGAAAINEDAVKTSAGALLHIPICKVESFKVALNYLKLSGVKLIGLTEKTDKNFFDLLLSEPLCIVMGSEETGLSSVSFQKIDELGMLPMLGKVSSLNVSVAAGIAMYQVVKQRLT